MDQRRLPMRVISLGLSRTGTATIQAALQEVGIPCFHYLDLLADPRKSDEWCAALDAKFFNKGKTFTRKEWDALLGDTSATCDMPTWAFAPELVEAYPEAKVILVKRNVESWFRSFDENVIGNLYWWPHYISYLDPWWSGRLRWLADRAMEGYFEARNQAGWRRNARRVYQRHNQLVRDIVPKDRLLELDLSDGWGPLCQFLDVQVPDTPFPRVNENDLFKVRMGQVLWQVVGRAVRNAVLLVGIVIFILYLFRQS